MFANVCIYVLPKWSLLYPIQRYKRVHTVVVCIDYSFILNISLHCIALHCIALHCIALSLTGVMQIQFLFNKCYHYVQLARHHFCPMRSINTMIATSRNKFRMCTAFNNGTIFHNQNSSCKSANCPSL